MALLKKVHPEWSPAEKRDLVMGETIDMDPYEDLVKSGMAILVDEQGTELPLATNLECPICFQIIRGLNDFVAHVSTHAPKKPEPVVREDRTTEAPVSAEETPENKEDKLKQQRLANLAKAREAAQKARNET